jgi:hypothetical protein
VSAPYWEYLRWAGYAVACIGAWRYLPLCVVRLAAAFTRDQQRHRQCMEVLRLARRDASRITPYLSDRSPVQSTPPDSTEPFSGLSDYKAELSTREFDRGRGRSKVPHAAPSPRQPGRPATAQRL